jgi:hypothetical protein
MPDGRLAALLSAAFSVLSKCWPQLQSRLSNGFARATSLMVMLKSDPAPRYVEKAGCSLRRLRDAISF